MYHSDVSHDESLMMQVRSLRGKPNRHKESPATHPTLVGWDDRDSKTGTRRTGTVRDTARALTMERNVQDMTRQDGPEQIMCHEWKGTDRIRHVAMYIYIYIYIYVAILVRFLRCRRVWSSISVVVSSSQYARSSSLGESSGRHG